MVRKMVLGFITIKMVSYGTKVTTRTGREKALGLVTIIMGN